MVSTLGSQVESSVGVFILVVHDGRVRLDELSHDTENKFGREWPEARDTVSTIYGNCAAVLDVSCSRISLISQVCCFLID